MVSNLGLGMGNQLREGQLINDNEKMGLKGMKEDEHGWKRLEKAEIGGIVMG